VSIWIYILILAVLIFLHELGHFLAARRNGIVVEEFGLGLPPKILSLGRRGGTEFTLNLLPIGGFARMRGEDQDMGPGSFWSASVRARTAVLLAGPLMNIVTALAVLTLTYAVIIPGGGLWVVDVAPDFPAAQVGIRAGDVITALNGNPVNSRQDFVASIRAHADEAITLTVRRGGDLVPIVVRPQVDPVDGVPRIGVLLTYRVPWWQAPITAVRELGRFTWSMLTLPSELLRGQVSPGEARPLGPVGIGRVFVEVVSEQPSVTVRLFTILRLTGIISFALGLTNLLPIPALDGGRLMFVVLEVLRRGKRISSSKEGLVHLVGMAFLLALMVIITYYDLRFPPNV